MKLLIHGSPTAAQPVKFYLSGGFIKNCGLLTYYLKDHLSNEAFISTTFKQDTDFVRSTDDVWGLTRVRLAFYGGYITMLQKLVNEHPTGADLVIEFMWINGKFPLKAFEYIFNLTKRRHIYKVNQLHKDEVSNLSSHFSSIAVCIITKGKPVEKFWIADY